VIDALVVGLGNPGKEYARTRHNVGEETVRLLATRHGGSWKAATRDRSLISDVTFGGRRVLLAFPTTYMNDSGIAVRALMKRHGVDDVTALVVVHDELDLPPGQMKLKQGGGNGGHNGLKDIQAQLGAGDFWRLRLGIGHPGVKAEVVNYVLRKPPADEREAIERNIDDSLKLLEPLLAGEMERVVMKLHAKPARPKPPRPADAPVADANGGTS
jgi:PTH1 family peptidyl-tRNA hydrolase